MARTCALAAAASYLAVALWVTREVWPAPSELLLSRDRARQEAALTDADQRMVLSVVMRNARLLPTRPWALATEGQCHPTPRPYTLGEHMFGNGLLAALPYWITGDPILTYNVLLLLTLWIPGLTMYALSLHFTRSPAAAFVAGLCFVLTPMRLDDPAHPYVHGDLWTPLALLFLHRLFTAGTWRSAIAFVVFFSLEIIEGSYALLSTALLVAALGAYLCVRQRRSLGGILSKVLVSAGAIAAVAWLVVGPYIEAAGTWGTLRRDFAFFAVTSSFLPGNRYFPGAVVTMLALIALLDRMRAARTARGYDPRLVFLAAGFLVIWASSYSIGLPLVGKIPSPLRLAREFVPGLDAIRVMAAVRLGGYLAIAFLAGYGALALIERLRTGRQVAAAALMCVALLLELFTPRLAALSFGQLPIPEAVALRPPQEEIELAVRSADGAVLDLPYQARDLAANSRYLLLSAFHERPVAACYNSFRTPVQYQIERLAKAVPAPRALEALSALGFETILLHRDRLTQRKEETVPRALARAATRPGGRLTALGSAGAIDAYRLSPPSSVADDFALLGPGKKDTSPVHLDPKAVLEFTIRNRSDITFVHPKPVAPSDLLVRWRNPAGELVLEAPARALLPLALAAGATSTVEVSTAVPELAEQYEVTLSRSAQPDIVLARGSVEVTPPPAHEPRERLKREPTQRRPKAP